MAGNHKSGVKRVPDNIKVLRGTARPDRMNPDAPKQSDARPHPPEWLPAEAYKWFEVFVGRLEELGLASATYTDCIAEASMRICDVVDATRDIELYGTSYVTKDGIVKRNPMVDARGTALKHLQSLLGELGLTPASLSKVSVPGKGGRESNPYAGF